MISELPIFQIYEAMARHAAESQKVSAGNLSRAGEPGYKALAIESFQDYFQRSQDAGPGAPAEAAFRTFEAQAPAAPNGNTVSIEREVFNSAASMGQHGMALTVYAKTLGLMRTAIGMRG